MSTFLHVYVKPREGVSQADVEEKLGKGIDWFRYAPGLYVVYTTSDVDRWYRRLSPLVKPGGNVFICELDIDERQGWMSKAFWDWIHTYDED